MKTRKRNKIKIFIHRTGGTMHFMFSYFGKMISTFLLICLPLLRVVEGANFLLYDWHPVFQTGLSLIQTFMEKRKRKRIRSGKHKNKKNQDRLTLVVEDIYNRRGQGKKRSFSQALDPCMRTHAKPYLLSLKSGGRKPDKKLNTDTLQAFETGRQVMKEATAYIMTFIYIQIFSLSSS